VNGYFTSPPSADPMLIRDGAIVPGSCSPPYCMRDPRTAFGVTADATALLVTVDGRMPGATGMKRVGLARLMLALGAVWAVNLDGGGSTTMVAGGRVVNRPSDLFRERRVRTILLLTRSSMPGVAPALRSLRRLDPRIVAPILLP
jgi:exopolysaccharide biosynthesis protein